MLTSYNRHNVKYVNRGVIDTKGKAGQVWTSWFLAASKGRGQPLGTWAGGLGTGHLHPHTVSFSRVIGKKRIRH